MESSCGGSRATCLTWESTMSTAFAFQPPFDLACPDKRLQSKEDSRLPLLPAQRSQTMEAYSYPALYRAVCSAPESPFSRFATAPVAGKGSPTGHSLQPLGMPKLLSASLSSPELKGLVKDEESLDTSAAKAAHAELRQQKEAATCSRDAVVPELSQQGSIAPGRASPSSAARADSHKLCRPRGKQRRRGQQVEKMDDLQAVLHYNVALQSRAKRMEKTLAARGKEIARLSAELERVSASKSEASCCAANPPAAAACAAGELLGRANGRLTKLQRLAETHGLRGTNPDGMELTTPVLEQLRGAVREACAAAEEALAAASPSEALPALEAACEAAPPGQVSVWRGIVQAVKLSREQAAKVEEWRTELLARMQALVQEGTTQLAELAVPAGAPSGGGCLSWARANVEAAAALARMLERLRAQRRALAGANSRLLLGILSPVQAALLMLHAWPAHCDCLGFAGAVKADLVADAVMTTATDMEE